MGKIAFQATRTTAGTINSGEAIFFDSTVTPEPTITIDTTGGGITITAAGKYEVDWSVSVQSALATHVSSFSLRTSQGAIFASNAPISTTLVTGSCILVVDVAPVTLFLENTNTDAQFLSTLNPIKANIVISGNNYLGSYAEMRSNLTQTVAVNGNVTFEEEVSDIVGTAITFNGTDTITLNELGLYYISWIVNLSAVSVPPIVFAILEDDLALLSGIENSSTTGGNFAGGALVQVFEVTVPHTINLVNISGTAMTLESIDRGTAIARGSSAVFMIMKISDGPNV